MKHAKIIPPDLADSGAEIAITEWLQARGITRVGRHGDQWNVYLTGNRFACGKSVEDALDSIGVGA